jgi:short-subunit dehydrogenase
MKTVVITGSAKGLGFELAKEFKKNNYNIVISDITKEKLEESEKYLTNNITSSSKVISVLCDVTKEQNLQNLINKTLENFKTIDIWINNAGVNQQMIPIWELENESIHRIIDIDLRSSIIAAKLVMKQMIKQGDGQIYGIEGYGSNDATMLGLSIYGTSKRAITYFYKALAKEVKEKNLNIKIGLLAPGIMITDFLTTSVENKKFELSEKTKKVYNILGDYPEPIAKFLVSKIITNKQNNVRFNWLTNKKAALRFMTSSFNKRDFFTSKK